MKYVFITFVSVLLLFFVFATFVVIKSADGTLDACIYKFEECLISENGSENKPIRIFSCSNKSFVCNLKTVYYSIFNQDKLDKEYNEHMQERLTKEFEQEEKLKALGIVVDEYIEKNNKPLNEEEPLLKDTKYIKDTKENTDNDKNK